ncbi:MAG: PD40 domain-containing protein [Nocardioidaceae bacterium]|nr:PD40 domain-containing protein [Nocardioidaceae bacterium]
MAQVETGPSVAPRGVAVGAGAAQANGGSYNAAVSAHGRYVVFESTASNLVAGDTNDDSDVFVRNRVRDVTRRVSVGKDGAQGNSGSFDPAVSADGRYVAFHSYASNLVAGDTNRAPDVFVRDRVRHVTRRVSVGAGGAQANSASIRPAVSADGRYVAFDSHASNLVAGDTNRTTDVFVRDRVRHVTRRVSVGAGGAQANHASTGAAVSADGRYVAFHSLASNLVAGDTNGHLDVFVRDRVRHVTRRVSVGAGGAQANTDSYEPAVSADGRYVAFRSYASNLVAGDTNGAPDVFVRDRVRHVTRRVSVGAGGAQANAHSYSPAVSAHGRYVAFSSDASNLVAGDTNRRLDVFVRDRVRHVTRRVSVGAGGAEANRNSHEPAVSAHGRYVAFHSLASNLVAGDTNVATDVFVRDRVRHVTRRVTVADPTS